MNNKNTEYGVDFLLWLHKLVTVRNTVPWKHWEPTATHSALLLPHWPAGGDRAAERTQTCGGRQRGVELTQTCRGRQGAELLPEAATAEQWDLQFSSTKLEIMALTVQTKPRPPGSDPDTRKNNNNYRKRVPFTLTLNWLWIRFIHLQQELSSRTGSSCSTVQSDFSLREGRSDLLHVSSSSTSLPHLPPHLLLQLLNVSSSTDRCWFVWPALCPSRGSECRNPSDWVGS